MRALAPIYSPESLDLRKPRLDRSHPEKESESQKESQNAHVGRPAGRSTHSTVDRPGRPRLTESEPLSVGRSGRSIAPSCARSCTPVDRAVDREHNLACSMRRFSLPLSFDLCVIFFHLLYLLSLTILHLGEDFSNLSRSPTNSSL